MTPESTAEIPDALTGQRLDRVVAFVTGLPRSDAAELVAAGAVRVGGRPATRGARRMERGEVVEITTPGGRAATLPPDPSVPLDLVHEDPWLVVVDKPAGLVVHPGAGHQSGTLVNGLLARYPEMVGVGDPARPGIVHRLDKGTSGLMVVARTAEAYAALVAMMAARRISRSYLTLVRGSVEADRGVVDAPVGRSSRQPTRMAVTPTGRGARTNYRVLRRWPDAPGGDRAHEALQAAHTLLECSLETGRTHQIRVHLAAIGHPVVGDPAYGRPLGRGAGGGATRRRGSGDADRTAPTHRGTGGLRPGRPFLHAHNLAFEHPAGTGGLDLTSPLPADLVAVLESLGE